METLELQHYAHKVGVNVHHLEWCTKYRYNMMRQEEYKNACENAIRQQADRHHICIRELFVMPEHVHVSCELPTTMSQSKALQLLKGGSSYLLFRTQPKFRLRYPRGHFWSSGAYAGSAGYNTVDIIDAYVRNKKDIHQKTLSDFTGSPALKCGEDVTVEQRPLAVLIKHLVGKSNRSMAAMFVIFSLLSDIDVSYKTVERFYSDPEVIAVLYNLHILILKKKGIKEIDGAGDGTGYSLTIKTHYASAAQKLKDKIKDAKTQSNKEYKKTLFVYSFKLIDIETRMYTGFGTSFKSEKDAFEKALQISKETGIQIRSIRLDKFYSAEAYVKICQEYLGKVKTFIIPKSNIRSWRLVKNDLRIHKQHQRILTRILPKKPIRKRFRRRQKKNRMETGTEKT